MTLRQAGFIAAILAAFFLFGWCTGRHSGRGTAKNPEPIAGVVPADTVAKGMTAVKPDTIFVPVPVYTSGPERIVYSTEVQPVNPAVVPVGAVDPGPERDAAVEAALVDWNTKRAYKGVLFDDPGAGKATYGFDVQFNRAGQITYRFDPAPIPKARRRLRPSVGGEYYTNGQYSFGAGVQYGAFGVNLRALKIPGAAAETGYAFGLGAQIIF